MGVSSIHVGPTESLEDSDATARWNIVGLAVGALGCLAILSTALWAVSAVRGAPYVMENDHRLAPSLALLKGYTLYQSRTGGPVLSTIYGPFTAFAYLPSALIHNPVWAIHAGALLSLCLFFLPSALLLWQLTRHSGLPAATSSAGLISFALLVQAIPSLERSSTMIHADAPAIGAAALSCFFLLKERSRFWISENFLLAGLFAGVSSFSKQNMVPFVVMAAVWLLCCEGWAPLGWFLAGASGVAVASVFLFNRWLGDPSTIFFNLVTIPAHQPYLKIKLFDAFHELEFQALIFLALAVTLSLLRMIRHSALDYRRPEWLLISSAIALSVTSVLGAIKLGGSVNALAPAAYFALLAISYSLCTLPSLKESARAFAHPACLAMAVLALLFCPFCLMQAASSLRQNRGASLVEQVYRYALVHPDQVYFPEYPLAVLAAEGRLYHFAWGLEDRAVAGFEVSGQQFRRFVPATDAAAVEENVPYMERWLLAKCHDDPSLPPISGLDGFKLCRIEGSGEASR